MKKLFTLLVMLIATLAVNAQLLCTSGFTWTGSNTGLVSFTNTSDSNNNGTITSYLWNFGDGTSSADANPTHTFTPGSGHYVCLTIGTSNGCSATFCDSVNVGNPNGGCTAGFTSQPGNALNSMIFVGTFNGQVNNNATYTWDFGDNNVGTGGPTHDHTYSAAGTYNVCVTVSNNGCTATYCQQVTVGSLLNCDASFTVTQLNVPGGYFLQPTVSGGTWTVTPANVQVNPSGEIFFTTNGTYTVCYAVAQNGQTCNHCETIVVGGSNTGCVSDFSWTTNPNGVTVFTNNSDSNNNGSITSYLWNFGDGTSSTGINPDHLFTQGQWYSVCLTITTANGCTSTHCDSIQGGSNVGGCQASFTYALSQVNVQTYHVTSSNSGNVYLLEWTVDGTLYTPAYDQQDFNIVFGDSGLHVICLTITDNNGCSDNTCMNIYVNNGNPNGGGCDPSFTVNPNPNNSNSVQFIPVPGQSVTHSWSFGDGTSSTNGDPVHVYSAPGIYSVCHTISGVNCSATYCDSVVIGGGFLGGGTISGIVYTGNNDVASSAYVFLLQFDYQNSALVPQDADVTQAGSYQFTNVPNGDYVVKAALTSVDPLYAVRIPTYYTSAMFWYDADVITINNNSYTGADIHMIEASNNGGPGFIGGSVDWADTLRAAYNFSGATVILQTLDGNNVAYAIADANGNYSFSNLAYGTYRLFADFAGVTGNPTEVTISAITPSVSDAQILLGPAAITSVQETSAIDAISLYPNPTADNATLVVATSKTAQLSLNIVNMMGQVVGSQTINAYTGKNIVQVNTDGLTQGVYSLVLRDSNGVAKTQRLIKK